MAFVPPSRHLARAKDLVDARYAELLRDTDHPIADVCLDVGLRSVGSFTTSFTRTYGCSPAAYRAAFPPARDRAMVPACVLRTHERPQRRTNGEDTAPARS
ncbi:helix-turn-helix domain-containing protein [Patulibacter sp. NPDC049589]|uniref:helix-turn-helix domain-containing protein n=1 Tax=Patulibacter sp. NPDC049589 TaxID=3154731 RepID=UPI003416F4DD